MAIPLLIFDDSPRARRSDPQTSHEAADTNDTARSRAAVLAVLNGSERPLADFEIESVHRTFTRTPFTPSRLRTARHELEEDGVVIPVGTTRTPTGRRATTWAIKGRLP